VAWGTGNRKDLLKIPNPSVNRFFFVIDNGGTATLHEADLRNITPAGGVTPAGVGPGASQYGYYLDYTTQNEKTTSTVYSTQGYLSIITFTPESNNPCATEGSSYRYRYFFLTGAQGYNIGSPTGDYRDYREAVGSGLVSTTQTTTPLGDVDDWLFHPDGGEERRRTLRNQRTINQNWKEQ
jgi:Tfp pilus tip-associated adhesin PilY1